MDLQIQDHKGVTTLLYHSHGKAYIYKIHFLYNTNKASQTFPATQNQKRWEIWKWDFEKYILAPKLFTFLIKALRRRTEVVSAEIVIAPPRRTMEPVANVRTSGGII